jgi:hypothetical protein
LIYLAEAGRVKFDWEISVDLAHEIMGGLDGVEREHIGGHPYVGFKWFVVGGTSEVF